MDTLRNWSFKLIASVCLFFAAAHVQASPVIDFYQSSHQVIDQVQGVRLLWRVRNAVRVDVQDGFRNTTYSSLGNENFIEVWPERTSDYTLVVYGENGQVISQRLTIFFNNVTIDFFFASTIEIIPGVPIRLSWNVRGATRIDVIDGSSNTLHQYLPGPSGYIEVYPTRTTTYQLIAYGSNNQAVSELVTVLDRRLTTPTPNPVQF